MNDTTVPAAQRGHLPRVHAGRTRTACATCARSRRPGLTHVHLLPAFDIATIDEIRANHAQPAVRPRVVPAGVDRSSRRASWRSADTDGFNWGYDPWHYTVPEGSYATDPNGAPRTLEFRQMVKALNETGLRVVMDVVYNHTNASGQAAKSVLDRIVPGYYHRLNAEGAVETSTCCQNTATEHAMMEKLMVDSVVTWAQAVQGRRLPLRPDGPPLEGEHARRPRGPRRADPRPGRRRRQARSTSTARAGTSARSRTAPASSRRPRRTWPAPGSARSTTGFATRSAAAGPSTATRASRASAAASSTTRTANPINGTPAEQRAKLLLHQDQIKVGLTGNLEDYRFVDRTGALVTGAQVDYNGSPAGYNDDPEEAITYVEAHDNETLFDALRGEAADGDVEGAAGAGADRRALDRRARPGRPVLPRRLGHPPLEVDGQELLQLGRLVQPARSGTTPTTGSVPACRPRRTTAPATPTSSRCSRTPRSSRRRRRSSGRRSASASCSRSAAARACSASATPAEIQRRLTFANAGPAQVAGLIVMKLSDEVTPDLDSSTESIIVLFNATPETKTWSEPGLRGRHYKLHKVQRTSERRADDRVAVRTRPGTLPRLAADDGGVRRSQVRPESRQALRLRHEGFPGPFEREPALAPLVLAARVVAHVRVAERDEPFGGLDPSCRTPGWRSRRRSRPSLVRQPPRCALRDVAGHEVDRTGQVRVRV